MNSNGSLSQMRGIWFGWPITHRLEDWCVTLDWMAKLDFNTLVFPVYYEWNALANLKSVPEMMAKNVIRATYWSACRGQDVAVDGPPPMSQPGAFPGLVSEAAARGIEVIPLITSFGHNLLLVAAYPEIRAQGPEDPCPVPCTSNPRTYELLFQIYQDVLDQYSNPPGFVHVAMDEQWEICECPACVQKGPVEVYIDHVSKIHGFFAARGIRMIMFDDMLRPQRSRHRRFIKRDFDSDEEIEEILDRIPKDIVMHLWHYSTPVEAEKMTDWVAWFTEHGFGVYLCPGHNVGRAHTLFDATPNALSMLEYGLNIAGASPGDRATGVIAYSPHLFPQEPYYHALAEKMKTGKDDGGRNFLRGTLGDRAEQVSDALVEITECLWQVPTHSRLPAVVESLAHESSEQRHALLSATARMAEAADSTLSLLEEIAQPSAVVSRLAAGFHLARTVASRLSMARALVEGKRKILAHLNARDLASADCEFASVRGALEDGLGHIESALRVLEPVLDWDRHVHRVLCLLSSERTFVENELRLLDLAQQNIDDVLHHRSSWPWPPGWCILP